MDYGKSLKAARKWAGLTQEALAAKASVATITIRQYEAGKRKPGTEIWFAIARALNLSVDELNNAELLPAKPPPPEPFNPEAIVEKIVQETRSEKRDIQINSSEDAIARIAKAVTKLNEDGEQEAVKRVEELTEIPKYQRTENPPEVTQDSPDDKK